MKRNLLPLFALALTAVAARGEKAASAETAPDPAETAPAAAETDVAVRIDGEPAVRSSEVDELVAIQLAMAGRPGLSDALPPPRMQALRRNCTDRLVATWLLMREAREKGVVVTDEEFDAFLARPGAPNPLEIASRLRGVATLDRIRTDLRDSLVVEKLLSSITNGIAEPTEEQARARFDQIVAANPDAVRMPEQVTAAHVLVLVPKDAPAEEDAAALAKINGIRDRALAGEDFGALAAEFSEDPGSKDKGGVYTFGRGRMVKPFEDAAFSQPIGEVGPPVRTNYGYHILKVLERSEPRTLAFEDVREGIAAALRREAVDAAFQKHLRELRDAARIEFVADAVVSDPVEIPPAP